MVCHVVINGNILFYCFSCVLFVMTGFQTQVKTQISFSFQVIYIKDSNVIAPYRNERVSRRNLHGGSPLMCLCWELFTETRLFFMCLFVLWKCVHARPEEQVRARHCLFLIFLCLKTLGGHEFKSCVKYSQSHLSYHSLRYNVELSHLEALFQCFRGCCRANSHTEMATNKTLKLVSSLLQGAEKITFQLEVWSKTEDVVQTLLQVRVCFDKLSCQIVHPDSGWREIGHLLHFFNCSGICQCCSAHSDSELILQLHRASCLDKLGDQTAMVSQSALKVQARSRPLKPERWKDENQKHEWYAP